MLLGGTYFRSAPYRLLDRAFRSMNQTGIPGMVYLHPYEFEAYDLRTLIPSPDFDYGAVPVSQRIQTELNRNIRRLNRRQTGKKLQMLLADAPFSSIRDNFPGLLLPDPLHFSGPKSRLRKADLSFR